MSHLEPHNSWFPYLFPPKAPHPLQLALVEERPSCFFLSCYPASFLGAFNLVPAPASREPGFVSQAGGALAALISSAGGWGPRGAAISCRVGEECSFHRACVLLLSSPSLSPLLRGAGLVGTSLVPWSFSSPHRGASLRGDGLGLAGCWESWESLNLCSPATGKGVSRTGRQLRGGHGSASCPRGALPGHRQPHLLHS